MLASLLHVGHPHPHTRNHTHSPTRSHSQSKDAAHLTITQVPEPTMAPDAETKTATMEAFLAEVKALFESSLQPQSLYTMSSQLQREYHQKLRESKISMLPSFHHTLPTGSETGTILALDVGGSTFRIALIELNGKQEGQAATSRPSSSSTSSTDMEIRRLRSFPIDNTVRALRGSLFFDWMASRVDDVLAMDNHQADSTTSPLPMALAWSFPIEQTSTRTGSLLAMGKGFLATHGVEGHDICELVTSACRKRRLNVELQGIVNDASATLLSQAYRDPRTRISLIMGTGINAAVYLPVSSLRTEKFGRRDNSWWEEASHVLVNTELSMFGKDVWQSTRWDRELNAAHPLPDFQPLEYRAGGRFLGELVRLVLVEGIEQGVLFGGDMPRGLETPYGLDAGLVGCFEGDTTPHLTTAARSFTKAHPLPDNATPTSQDLHLIRAVSALVSTRAAAYVATAVHALWDLQREAARTCPNCANTAVSGKEKMEAVVGVSSVTIACNGSIMEKYPGFKKRCQSWLDELVTLGSTEEVQDGKEGRDGVIIEMAIESSVFGAAVAAVAEG